MPFEPEKWRNGENLPTVQGTIIGCKGHRNTVALVDTGDVHTMMIGAAGVMKMTSRINLEKVAKEVANRRQCVDSCGFSAQG